MEIILLLLCIAGLITQIAICLVLLKLSREIERQSIIVWNQNTAHVILKRKGFVRHDGSIEFWGDGDFVLPLGLKKHAGKMLTVLIVEGVEYGPE